MHYLDELNEPQRAAAENINGPMMVIAGAGSGKTRVLTYRIAHMIDNGVDPFNILSLTFTNKAAKEMKERISKMLGDGQARNVWSGTFHSIFARILRSESERIGYPSNFTIYDTQDSRSLIKAIVKEMGLDDKLYKPSIVGSRISSAKNNLISPQAYLQNTDIQADDRETGRKRLGEVYMEYAKRCFKSGAMDFDDLLFKTNVLLKNFPDVLEKYQNKFKYILVDEYQDTNYSQYLIVKRLAAKNQNLCVVGDDAQSIYAFRGADIQNILNFKKDYPQYKLFKLEQNYRSSKVIVNAANSIIKNNKKQIQKNVWTANDEGERMRVIKTYSDNEEGKFVANDIFEIQQNEQANNIDFAILYRTNAQSRSFEEALRKLNIKYRIYGGLSFYQRKEIKDLIAYFRLTANHNDEEALKRVINYPKRGIGKGSLEKATVAARENDVSLWEMLSNLPKYNLGINTGTTNKIVQFTTMIKSFATKLTTLSASDLASEIGQSSGLTKELYSDKTPEGVARYENIQELQNGIKEFTEKSKSNGEDVFLPDFLLDVALLTDADNDDEEDNDKVTLMTIHASKGLEFPYVYIVGLEEALFPSQMALNSRSELEEERRLFYVAVTRAEKKCTLSYAMSRYRWGNLISCEPSRFIEEIDEKFLDLSQSGSPSESSSSSSFGGGGGSSTSFGSRNVESKQFGGRFSKRTIAPKQATASKPASHKPSFGNRNLKKVSTSNSAPSKPVDTTKLGVGVVVSHDRFGKGKILKIEGEAPNLKATVLFPSSGEKQLLLKYAKLTVIG